jgi:hypothetical protein
MRALVVNILGPGVLKRKIDQPKDGLGRFAGRRVNLRKRNEPKPVLMMGAAAAFAFPSARSALLATLRGSRRPPA